MSLSTMPLPWPRSAWQVGVFVCVAVWIPCPAVYQTFIGAMNEKIRRQFAVSNPFVFKHISNLKVGVLESHSTVM